MEYLLQYFLIIPFLGYLISLVIPSKNEFAISRLAFITLSIQLVFAIGFTIGWLKTGHLSINLKEFSIYQTGDYDFFIDLYFDRVSALFLLMGAFLTFLITYYSRFYLHREYGFKRFFNTILLFYLGYNIIILSGNFETLFIGWEFLGISSFLLIAFYRDRYLPVKNALKIFSLYRIGDIGLILAMWLSHHLFHENVTFGKMHNAELVSHLLQKHSWEGFFISFVILVAALVKSAQLPFSSWLPRAMEGPTPSSAIFYGSLSVHIGAFLLLRTHPFWEHQTAIRILIGFLGVLSCIIASMMARVQTSVKSQIAYSSIAQIGLIFLEIVAGFDDLALFHICGNALLRTYQLLISPSIASFKIKEQLYTYEPREKTIEDSLPKRIEYSFYILSLKEWNLETLIYQLFLSPLKKISRKFRILQLNLGIYFFVIIYVIGLVLLLFKSAIPPFFENYLPGFYAFIGLLMVIKAFTERRNVVMSWFMVMMNHFWIALAIAINDNINISSMVMYLSGVIFSGGIGYYAIRLLIKKEKRITLARFQGHAFEYPTIAFVFLLACLGVAGFPITPTMIGEDLVFSSVREDQYFLALFLSISLIVDGLALVRIYARLFLGPHVKTYHSIAHKSS
jgi:NADH:ubiquinone oxidoreductase subunit 5 (subunit L)/multisubunit Na+/H+ antiporter MnhA subunit